MANQRAQSDGIGKPFSGMASQGGREGGGAREEGPVILFGLSPWIAPETQGEQNYEAPCAGRAGARGCNQASCVSRRPFWNWSIAREIASASSDGN